MTLLMKILLEIERALQNTSSLTISFGFLDTEQPAVGTREGLENLSSISFDDVYKSEFQKVPEVT